MVKYTKMLVFLNGQLIVDSKQARCSMEEEADENNKDARCLVVKIDTPEHLLIDVVKDRTKESA